MAYNIRWADDYVRYEAAKVLEMQKKGRDARDRLKAHIVDNLSKDIQRSHANDPMTASKQAFLKKFQDPNSPEAAWLSDDKFCLSNLSFIASSIGGSESKEDTTAPI